MGYWTFRITNGKELRKAIRENNGVAVINALKKCYEEILNNYNFEYDYDRQDFEDARELLDGDDIIIENCQCGIENISEYGFSNTSELVDERLTEFYDLCDNYNFWVEI